METIEELVVYEIVPDFLHLFFKACANQCVQLFSDISLQYYLLVVFFVWCKMPLSVGNAGRKQFFCR